MAKFQRFKVVQRLAEYILKQGSDCPIAISGREQDGKSTTSMQLGRWLNGNKLLDLEKNVGYNIREGIEELKQLPEGGIYILDEAIRAAWKREWYRSENKELVKLFRQIGEKRGVFFFNLPKFNELDTPLRDDRVAFWIHIIGKEDVDPVTKKPARIWAVLFEKNEHVHEQDPWGLREGFKKLNKYRRTENMILRTTSIKNIIATYMKIPNCTHYFSVPPLPDDYWAKYKALSSVRKLEDQNDAKDNMGIKEKNKVGLDNAIKALSKSGMTQEEIANTLKVYSQKQVSTRLALMRE